MSVSFEDSMLDFDINFLQPSATANETKIDRQRKQVHRIKKKNICTDAVIKKYYLYREKWEQNEVLLLTLKEECKQACINFQESLEKCTTFEKDLDTQRKLNAELQSSCTVSQNQYEGMKCHANQLQLLIKQHESTIEALKVEALLNSKNNTDDFEKKFSSMQVENKALLKHISLLKEIVFGKRKLRNRHKILLQKYDNLKDVSDDDSSSDSSCDQPEFLDDAPDSPLFTSHVDAVENKIEDNVFKTSKTEACIKKDLLNFNEENDSNCSNEVTSEDTGRGSSLAFSDGDKCFSSPDYFSTDSPITREISKIHGKTDLTDSDKRFSSLEYFNTDSAITKENGEFIKKNILVDSATSPIRNVVTSPRIFDDVALLSDSNTLFGNLLDSSNTEYFITDEIPLSDEIITIKEKRKLVDIGTSPIKDLDKVHTSTSPLLFIECVELDEANELSKPIVTNSSTSDINGLSDISNRKTPSVLIDDTITGLNGKHTVIDNLASHCEIEISGKSINQRKCLDKNNSKNYCNENSNDSEIEMILNTMRLRERLITPIPKTPVHISNDRRKAQNPEQTLPLLSCESQVGCMSLKISEDHRILFTSLKDLKIELMNIMSLLKNNLQNNKKCSKCNVCLNCEQFESTNDNGVNENEENELASAINNFNVSTGLRNRESQLLTIADANECSEIIIQNHPDSRNISEIKTSYSAPQSQSIPDSNEFPKTNNLIEEGLRFTSVNNVASVAKNDIREALTFEDDSGSEGESDIIINNNVDHTIEEVIDCSINKKRKSKKMSKLDKFKQKLLPKFKIAKTVPARKLSKIKLRPVTITLTKIDPVAILNNKAVYANAAKILAEIKGKENKSTNKKRIARNTKKVVDSKKDNLENILDSEQQPSETDSNRTKRLLRRKSNNQQDLKSKKSESKEEVVPQINLSPMTRSRSRQLSSSSNVSLTEINTKKTNTSKCEDRRTRLKRKSTESSIDDNKRVLRSSNRGSNVNSDNMKVLSNHNYEMIHDKPFKKRNRQLAKISENEEKNASIVLKNTTNTPNKIYNQRLSKSDENKKQSTSENSKKVCNSPDKVNSRKLFNSGSDKQHLSDGSKMIFTSTDIQSSKLYMSKNEVSRSNNVNKQDHNKNTEATEFNELISHPKHSILCRMLEKYARKGNKPKKIKVPENIVNSTCEKLKNSISTIIELPANETNVAMSKLFDEIQSWEISHFMLGLVKYFKEPNWKDVNTVQCLPAPPMTNSEQVILYLVRKMRNHSPKTLNTTLDHIKFILFQLNNSPDFEIIDRLSHLYALLCRYFGLKTRLRLFMLDALYCIRFKAVPLIKQCLDIWMHTLPLAHTGTAKSPLVTCIVYLLYYYKCDNDYKRRVSEIRTILKQKYFYDLSDWNEPKILEMFKNAIIEVQDVPVEKTMLRMALIIMGKRLSPEMCHKKIIKNILLPMIEKQDVSMKIKQFCVKMLGPLLKPFPAAMKVHVEIIVNYLYEMLDQSPPHAMKEAIFTSLIYINHHNPNRLTRSLLSWGPKQISPEFEDLLRDYVRVKPLDAWKKILSRITI